MKRNIRNHKGFTLIELSIVLIIIGIILAAVLKGQDLVTNARAKQFVSNLNAWQIALNIYLDRKGHYPGNNTAGTAGLYNGVICGVTATDDPQGDITAAQFVSSPLNSFALGANTYYVFLGNNGTYNVLVVCLNATCTASENVEAAKFFESFDTDITGVSDATGASTSFSVYGITSTPTFGTLNTCIIPTSTFTVTASKDWLSTSNITTTPIKALVYRLQ